MRVRHRVPMVFSLSMLDVFCCALGCVTLLWLVNQREAMLRARDASGAYETLEITRRQLKDLNAQFAATTTERDKLRDSVRQLQSAYSAATSQAERLSKDLAAATTRADDTADLLTKAKADLLTLTRESRTAKATAADLADRLRDENARLAAADTKVDDLAAKLRASEAAAAKLRDSAAMIPGLEKTATETSEKLAASQTQVRNLSSELETARRALAGVDVEKKELATKLARAQLAVENRFEGVTLTGRRVIFLVDMSGSMEMVDSNTAAPNKWAAVRETVLKLFRSLPDLEKYQVILFSEQATFPLGNEGRWLDPDPRSAERITAALSSIRPKGNTNMYQGMDAAFRFRAQGLDTIYLLSDGLPNIGEGLTADQATRMTESQRGEILSRVIRNTLRGTWNAPQSGRPAVKINSIGFFYESPEVGAFLWALSREHGGSFVGMSRP